MLHVDFKEKIGYYTLVGADGKKFKVHFCEANALCAMIHFYKDENGKRWADCCGFFGDVKHAERCINAGYFQHCGRFVFDARRLTNDLWKMIRMITENGIKVTIK